MLTQVGKHNVEQPAMHGTESLRKEVRVGGLVPKIEIPRVPVIGQAVALQPIPQPLELSTSDLVLRLPLHFAGLLVGLVVIQDGSLLMCYFPG
jgi:hypothetical protein